jgi:hypothetical protein
MLAVAIRGDEPVLAAAMDGIGSLKRFLTGAAEALHGRLSNSIVLHPYKREGSIA